MHSFLKHQAAKSPTRFHEDPVKYCSRSPGKSRGFQADGLDERVGIVDDALVEAVKFGSSPRKMGNSRSTPRCVNPLKNFSRCKAPQSAEAGADKTEGVAQTIVELAHAGETSPERVRAGALRRLIRGLFEGGLQSSS